MKELDEAKNIPFKEFYESKVYYVHLSCSHVRTTSTGFTKNPLNAVRLNSH